jgi:valyl-tRNA synthetase
MNPINTQNELPDRYHPNEVESKIYKWWEENGYFKSQDQSHKPPFSIILPPPNVTGFLHMGHALDHTIQDLLIRWKRHVAAWHGSRRNCNSVRS